MEDEECEEDGYPADQITIEVNNFECDGNEEQHWWATSVPGSSSASSSNVSVVRKPQLTKFKHSKGFREIVEYKQHHHISPKKFKKKKLEQGLTTLQRVVTDVPDEECNKLKRPGPFQAASRVTTKTLVANRYLNKFRKSKIGQEKTNNNGSVNQNEMGSSICCQYCKANLTTILEKDLHISAQHKHEISTQERPISCLEQGCAVTCLSLYTFKQHLIHTHHLHFASKFYTFQTFDEFSSWKHDMEASSGTRFMFFSSFSEVTGGTTRVYVCNNESSYDHNYVRLEKKRRLKRAAQIVQPKKGRACIAQMLVRSWGWGAIEVDATLMHYGHTTNGVPRGLEQRIVAINKPPEAATAGAAQTTVVSSSDDAQRNDSSRAVDSKEMPDVSGEREGGVRIIEGSLLGNRGMEELQEDLSRWELYDNVSICVCKRRYDTCCNNTQLVDPEDFVLGFSTSDQLDVWAAHGARAVCLDATQVAISDCDGGELLTVLAVLVFNASGDPLPVAWLLTTKASERLTRYFFACLKMAFESFHSLPVPTAAFMVCEGESGLHRAWHDVFAPTQHMQFVAAADNKEWMATLRKIAHLGKRAIVFEELRVCARNIDSIEAMTAVVERLAYDENTAQFASYMIYQYLPNSQQARLNTTPPCDNVYNLHLYFDILQGLFSFLFVEEDFTTDYDECVAKVNRYSATLLEEAGSNVVTRVGHTRTAVEGLVPSIGHHRWLQLLEDRHKEAGSLGLENVSPLTQHSWRVRCHLMAGVVHTVTRHRRNKDKPIHCVRSICNTNCKQVCWRCEVCVHQYSCTCPDSIIMSTICVHVHLIRIFVLNPHHVPLANIAPVALPKTLASNNDLSFKKEPNSDSSKDNLKQSIQNKCCSIISIMKNNVMNSKLNMDCLLNCDQQLDIIHEMLERQTTCTTRRSSDDTLPLPTQSSLCHTKQLKNASSSSQLSVNYVTPMAEEEEYNLGHSLVTNDGLLVLHEENGRYSLVSGECKSELLESSADKNDLLYLPEDEDVVGGDILVHEGVIVSPQKNDQR